MNIPTTYLEFQDSLELQNPPPSWPATLQSLWFLVNDNWEASHTIAQDIEGSMGNLIHAHLHRVEGDEWNATYWYKQAGTSFPEISLEEELKQLVNLIIS